MATNSRVVVQLMAASAAACVVLLVLACVVIAIVPAGPPVEPRERIDESRARAAAIGVLLDVFMVHKGSYPPSLETLEQELGVKIDRPTVGHWEYRVSTDGESYSIRICDNIYWDCYPSYTLRMDGEWDVDS